MRQPAANRIAAHDAMVTCLDAFENILVSGGLDKKIAVWDIRNFENPVRKFSLDDTSILKIAVGPTINYACVSTMKGFYLVDFATNTPKTVVPFKEADKKFNRYHDMKWSPDKNVLYAAGDDKRVDQFVVRWG
jgi:WD40 repeat protein